MTTDRAMLDADTAARRDALDVTRSFIVQAPAGSGKTELLIQRYLCLLAVVAEPEEVLAITFTRKAAAEMQERVLAALRCARDGTVAASDHERHTLELASTVIDRDRDAQWGLLHFPGRMRVMTVDAFGAGIARTTPVVSGIGVIAAVGSDRDIEGMCQSAAIATLDYLPDNGPAADAVALVLGHLDANVDAYVRYVANMLGSREQWLAITGSGRLEAGQADRVRRRLEANVRDVVERQLRQLDALVPPRCREELPDLLRHAAAQLAADGAMPPGPGDVSAFASFPGTEATDTGRWTFMADTLLTQTGNWRKSVDKRNGFPPGDDGEKVRLKALLEAIRDFHDFREALHRTRSLPPATYRDDQWNVLMALFEVLPLAVAELRRIFAARNMTDHTEVALAAGRALGTPDEPGDIALMLDYQVRHMLVDEMQDTSINQYELLKNLTSGWAPGDGRTVFCVGDPMQSIYRFRDAEVGEFLLARRNGIGTVPLEALLLRRNFRSGANLVRWFNSAFVRVMPLKDDIAVGAIGYAESAAVESKKGLGRHEVYPLFDADAAAEAVCTHAIVRTLLDGTDGEDVAILVRSRTQLNDLLPLLRADGIAYESVEIDRLTDLPEIIDLLALTRALCHEGDRLAWLGLLRGPWVGLCWSDLHTLARNDATSTLPELWDDAARQAAMTPDGLERLRRFVEVIEPFRSRNAVDRLRDRVELAWHALSGPAILERPDQLDNVCLFLDALGRTEVDGTLDDVAELEARLDAERVSSGARPDCRVKVMTMHKAKGLQFDHVVLHGLGRRGRGDGSRVLDWLTVPDDEGRSELVISPVGPRGEIDKDPLHRFIAETEKEKVRMELDRLLYVACTRARLSLHLVGHVAVDREAGTFRHPGDDTLLGRLWPAIESDVSRRFVDWRKDQDGSAQGPAAPRRNLVQPVLSRFTQPWQRPDVPDPPRGTAERAPAATEEKHVEYEWVGAAARYTGTIVHRWLQQIADGRVQVSLASLQDLVPVSRRWARELGASSDAVQGICDRTLLALRGMLDHDVGRWILGGSGESELALTGLVEGRTESIVIDRIRIDDDGTHWIVDYKTSTHEGGDLDGFLAQEEARYGPQLRKYAAIYSALEGRPVRTGLYFPLLQAFREIR